MLIRELQRVLAARHLDDYESGHMGSRIARFVTEDGRHLVAKCAAYSDTNAMADIKANVRGYAEIEMVGLSDMLPPALRQLDLTEHRVLVMEDLGRSVAQLNSGMKTWATVARSFESRAMATATTTRGDYVEEVTSHIARFSTDNELVDAIRRKSSVIPERSALMLLDFTPDNVYVRDESFRFLDPWDQRSYLGHPCVSLAQFATLARIYRLKDAEMLCTKWRTDSVQFYSELLACDESVSLDAYKLGETLQLTLSAYVRRNSDPSFASSLHSSANALW